LSEIAFPLGDVSFWMESLEDSDPDTRWQAALVLGIARVAEAEGQLVGMLGDDDDQVRAWGAWALGRLAAVDKVGYLTPLLEDPSPRVHFQAHRALVLIQGEKGMAGVSAQLTIGKAEKAGKKILISDDDSELLNLYKLILETILFR